MKAQEKLEKEKRTISHYAILALVFTFACLIISAFSKEEDTQNVFLAMSFLELFAAGIFIGIFIQMSKTKNNN